MSSRLFRFSSLLFLLVISMAPVKAAENPLVNMVMSQLGVTQTQATSGLGALLSTAQPNMSKADFAELSNVIPNMNGLLAAAPAMEAPANDSGGLMSMATSMFGGTPANDGLILQQAFSALGLNTGMLGQFSQILLDFVNTEGGQALMQSLKAALI